MSHFDHVANEWESERKIKLMGQLAEKTKAKLNLKDKLDIMDFGCGTGLYGLAFFENARSLTGVDTSQAMLDVFDKKTEAYGNVRSLKIDLEKEPALAEKYDLVLSSMAFHHLIQPGQMIKKLKDMLNPQGRIVIVDLEPEDGSFHSDPKDMGVHHFGFSEETLRNWAKDAGLQVEVHTIHQIDREDGTYGQFMAVFSVVH